MKVVGKRMKLKALPSTLRARSTSPQKRDTSLVHKRETPFIKRLCSTGEETEEPFGGCRREEAKLLYNTGKNVCRVTAESIERTKTFGRRASDLKFLLAMKKCGEKDLEDPTNFPHAKMILSVIRIGLRSQQAWDMIEEAEKTFETPHIIITENNELTKLKQFCWEGAGFTTPIPL